MNTPALKDLQFNVKMLNDITRNLGAGKSTDQAADAVKNHLTRFWAPSMIDSLVANRSELDTELLPAAKLALQRLT